MKRGYSRLRRGGESSACHNPHLPASSLSLTRILLALLASCVAEGQTDGRNNGGGCCVWPELELSAYFLGCCLPSVTLTTTTTIVSFRSPVFIVLISSFCLCWHTRCHTPPHRHPPPIVIIIIHHHHPPLQSPLPHPSPILPFLLSSILHSVTLSPLAYIPSVRIYRCIWFRPRR